MLVLGATGVQADGSAPCNTNGTNSTECGEDSLASGNRSTAVGEGSKADKDDATAVGRDSRATGTESTALGRNAQATGDESTAVGRNAKATGAQATALGTGASAFTDDTAVGYMATVAADGSVSMGARTLISTGATNSVAIGADSMVGVDAFNSVAVGQGSSVVAGVENSVALGQASIAAQSNVVSVGSATQKRRITNVADGIGDYDAVNVRQLDELSDRLNEVGALTSAFSALVPNARAPGNTQVSLGLGGYKGEVGFAAGMFHYVNDNVLINGGVSTSGSETTTRAGVTFGW